MHGLELRGRGLAALASFAAGAVLMLTGGPAHAIYGGNELDKETRQSRLGSLLSLKTQRGDVRSQCGAVIISPKKVLTAGHCIVKEKGGKEAVPEDALALYSGGLNSEGGKKLSVSEVHLHPDYTPGDFNKHEYTVNDIAVLILKDEVDGKAAVALDDGSKLVSGTVGLTGGWGATEWGDDLAPTVRATELQIIETYDCQSHFPGFLTDEKMCAAPLDEETLRATGGGDSGGPLIVNADSDKPVLVGVVSVGKLDPKPGDPSAFVQVASFLKWIKEVDEVQK